MWDGDWNLEGLYGGGTNSTGAGTVSVTVSDETYRAFWKRPRRLCAQTWEPSTRAVRYAALFNANGRNVMNVMSQTVVQLSRRNMHLRRQYLESAGSGNEHNKDLDRPYETISHQFCFALLHGHGCLCGAHWPT